MVTPGEDDRVGDMGVVVDERAGADDRPLDVRARHDRPLAQQAVVDERRLAAAPRDTFAGGSALSDVYIGHLSL